MTLAARADLARTTEEPAFELERRIDGIELRRHAPAVVAEAWVEGPAEQAGNQAFPILAGYFFGQNAQRRKLAMSSPVLQTAAPGGFVVQFLLPRDTTLAKAPAPTDPRVRLRELPARRVAAISGSGRWTDDSYRSHLELLKSALRSAGLHWTGEPVHARYNAPATLWILRRNEIWLSLP